MTGYPTKAQEPARPTERKGKVKKALRVEAMRKEKERIARLREAAAKNDLLEGYSAFKHFDRLGAEVTLESLHGADLSQADADACIALQRQNLAHLGSTDSWDEDAAIGALRHAESRVLLLRGSVLSPCEEAAAAASESTPDDDEWLVVPSASDLLGRTEGAPIEEMLPHPVASAPAVLGYLHLQFCIGELANPQAQPLLCVLNMQLMPSVMGKGLGKFALQFVELLARRIGLDLVGGAPESQASHTEPRALTRAASASAAACAAAAASAASPPLLSVRTHRRHAPAAKAKHATRLSSTRARSLLAQVMLYVKDGQVTTMSLSRPKPSAAAMPTLSARKDVNVPPPAGAKPPPPSEAFDEEAFEMVGAPEGILPVLNAAPVAVRC